MISRRQRGRRHGRPQPRASQGRFAAPGQIDRAALEFPLRPGQPSRHDQETRRETKHGQETAQPSGEPVAGNGILSRRIFLEGALVAGATGAGLAGASAEPLAIQPWMKTPGVGFVPYGQPSRFEDKVVRTFARAGQSGDARRRLRAHAARPARRHDHAVRAALRAQPLGHSRHRSQPASRGDPRPGAAPARVHARGAASLPDDVAHRVHRMRRQQRRAQRADRAAARRGRDPRPARVPGMDRREALDAARRSRRRAVGALDDRGRRRQRHHEPQHPARQGDG